MRALALVIVILSAADHWTTYLCLRTPQTGWQVTEANPIAEWLFAYVGLITGLLVDSVVTLGAIAFLITTQWVPEAVKFGFFGLVAAWTGIAVINNLNAISNMGLSLLGNT